MPSSGLVFGPNGEPRWMWTWPLEDPCPFSVPIEPGGRVIDLPVDLTEDEAVPLRLGLHALTLAEVARLRGVRRPIVVRGDLGPLPEEALVYNPGARLLQSRRDDGRLTTLEPLTEAEVEGT